MGKKAKKNASKTTLPETTQSENAGNSPTSPARRETPAQNLLRELQTILGPAFAQWNQASRILKIVINKLSVDLSPLFPPEHYFDQLVHIKLPKLDSDYAELEFQATPYVKQFLGKYKTEKDKAATGQPPSMATIQSNRQFFSKQLNEHIREALTCAQFHQSRDFAQSRIEYIITSINEHLITARDLKPGLERTQFTTYNANIFAGLNAACQDYICEPEISKHNLILYTILVQLFFLIQKQIFIDDLTKKALLQFFQHWEANVTPAFILSKITGTIHRIINNYIKSNTLNAAIAWQKSLLLCYYTAFTLLEERDYPNPQVFGDFREATALMIQTQQFMCADRLYKLAGCLTEREEEIRQAASQALYGFAKERLTQNPPDRQKVYSFISYAKLPPQTLINWLTSLRISLAPEEVERIVRPLSRAVVPCLIESNASVHFLTLALAGCGDPGELILSEHISIKMHLTSEHSCKTITISNTDWLSCALINGSLTLFQYLLNLLLEHNKFQALLEKSAICTIQGGGDAPDALSHFFGLLFYICDLDLPKNRHQTNLGMGTYQNMKPAGILVETIRRHQKNNGSSEDSSNAMHALMKTLNTGSHKVIEANWLAMLGHLAEQSQWESVIYLLENAKTMKFARTPLTEGIEYAINEYAAITAFSEAENDAPESTADILTRLLTLLHSLVPNYTPSEGTYDYLEVLPEWLLPYEVEMEPLKGRHPRWPEKKPAQVCARLDAITRPLLRKSDIWTYELENRTFVLRLIDPMSTPGREPVKFTLPIPNPITDTDEQEFTVSIDTFLDALGELTVIENSAREIIWSELDNQVCHEIRISTEYADAILEIDGKSARGNLHTILWEMSDQYHTWQSNVTAKEVAEQQANEAELREQIKQERNAKHRKEHRARNKQRLEKIKGWKEMLSQWQRLFCVIEKQSSMSEHLYQIGSPLKKEATILGRELKHYKEYRDRHKLLEKETEDYREKIVNEEYSLPGWEDFEKRIGVLKNALPEDADTRIIEYEDRANTLYKKYNCPETPKAIPIFLSPRKKGRDGSSGSGKDVRAESRNDSTCSSTPPPSPASSASSSPQRHYCSTRARPTTPPVSHQRAISTGANSSGTLPRSTPKSSALRHPPSSPKSSSLSSPSSSAISSASSSPKQIKPIGARKSHIEKAKESQLLVTNGAPGFSLFLNVSTSPEKRSKDTKTTTKAEKVAKHSERDILSQPATTYLLFSGESPWTVVQEELGILSKRNP